MSDNHWMKYTAGFLFGTVGMEILKSGIAQKAYTYATAGVFLAKDRVLETAEKVQACAIDIADDAKEITEHYYQEKDRKFEEDLAKAEAANRALSAEQLDEETVVAEHITIE